ncbi:MAG TPA: L,D-transpeptidase family protein [Acidimicrobiales bacterium]|nr:L,D-transpeptidase family protein [Acidimicrobiales bacterium]
MHQLNPDRPAAKRLIATVSVALAMGAALLVGVGIYTAGSRGSMRTVEHRVIVSVPGGTPAARTAPPQAVPVAATSRGPATTASALPAVGPGPETVAYALDRSLPVFPSPGAAGPTMTLANPNSSGAPLVLLVLGGQPGWVQVMLPVRPNESTGWVPREDVNLQQDDYAVVVSLSARALELYRDRAPVARFPVAVGASWAPTPPGNFYVTEVLAASNPNGAYGSYAFGLSDFSGTYSEFEGGPGQIAIHGTNQPWVIGTSASHGCVRVRDDVDRYLGSVLPDGSIVDIVP